MTGASWICLCSAPSPSRSSGAARSLRTLLNLVGHKPNRSEEHTSELQSQSNLVCRLLLEKKIMLTEKRCVKYAHILANGVEVSNYFVFSFQYIEGRHVLLASLLLLHTSLNPLINITLVV